MSDFELDGDGDTVMECMEEADWEGECVADPDLLGDREEEAHWEGEAERDTEVVREGDRVLDTENDGDALMEGDTLCVVDWVEECEVDTDLVGDTVDEAHLEAEGEREGEAVRVGDTDTDTERLGEEEVLLLLVPDALRLTEEG